MFGRVRVLAVGSWLVEQIKIVEQKGGECRFNGQFGGAGIVIGRRKFQ